MSENIWDQKAVYLKSFWGWSPETWASLGFTNQKYFSSLLEKTTNPFIAVVYVTKNSGSNDPDLRGKIVGFYVVSHETGHRNKFTHPQNHSLEPEKWQHSFRAVRAFTFIPEYRIYASELVDNISKKARSIATWGSILSESQIDTLKEIPFLETEIYKGSNHFNRDIVWPRRKKGFNEKYKVRGGATNLSGYYVEGEPKDTPKELYALKLKGKSDIFLDRGNHHHDIFKIGLSVSPKTRLAFFNNTLPKGQFIWELYKSTRLDGDKPYSGFEVAVKGENAMKEYLGKNGEWLGGEFYTASNNVFNKAWELGKEIALRVNL